MSDQASNLIQASAAMVVAVTAIVGVLLAWRGLNTRRDELTVARNTVSTRHLLTGIYNACAPRVRRRASLPTRRPATSFRTAVLLVFAGTATFLALIGIFGLVSYTVAQRHREIGLRVALGATYSRLVSLMLRQALVPTVLGIVAGTVGALAVSRLLAAFLFEVPATDPVTFSAAIGLFFCAAFVAGLVPALRSFRVDPAVALRHE